MILSCTPLSARKTSSSLYSSSDAAIKMFQQIKEMEKSHKIINVSDISFTDDGEIIEQAEVVEELIQEVVQGGNPDGGIDEKSS